MRGEEQGGGVLMRFLLYAVAMVLLAHAGGAEAGELKEEWAELRKEIEGTKK
ncbi:hypothetical protein LCGC14_2921310 [marine sediment metagenome]|uniref:Uncharacterized protein n=1 Tax=marine sediment metagenome TaxID=412755 RepID=A0A0F8XNZ2_9ZZZZ